MPRHRRPWWQKHIKSLIVLAISLFFIAFGMIIIWFSTLKIPDLSAFESRKVAESTKIYDRTGEILLYDVHNDARRTVVPFSEINQYIKGATISIEDVDFYNHIGIQPSSILRAIISNLMSGSTQGGSTITQQVIKNSILTKDKTITRKLKEWILSIKIEKILTKEQIFEVYLNESPYGGNLYGVEEASKAFFGKNAKDVTITEAAYLAAMPQAPTYYSPYGNNKDKLDARKNLVLEKMKLYGYITEEQYTSSIKEEVEFLERNSEGIRAPHFTMYVKQYLIDKYGEDMVEEGGLKVITSLDYDIQQKAEGVISKFAPTLQENFGANNIAMVAISPKNGDILSMIGSKDYWSKDIDGNFNVTTAHRQPGSTFKPFVYATAFMKGLTPETVLFDTKTEFSTSCTVDGKPKNYSSDIKCYSPDEYDGIFEGPMTIRQALAHSRNIPAVKTLYISGIKESIATAQSMGITSLTEPDKYGLTLVLGGGEVSLLELTSAYGVFANDGIRNPYRSILRIEDSTGKILEEAKDFPTQSIPGEIARKISDILSDPNVRLSYLTPYINAIGGKQVAIKTGTTNDYKDVWVEGYTPSIAVGFWAGKNDNTPMEKKVAGLIIAPVWGAFMAEINDHIPVEYFKKPEPVSNDLKPSLRGVWKGGFSYSIDTVSRKLATEYTPDELKEEIILNGVHSLLQWVDKKNPAGPIPENPQNDSQYEYWEYGVRKWYDTWKMSHPDFIEASSFGVPVERDNVHIPENFPIVSIITPPHNSIINSQTRMSVDVSVSNKYPLKKSELYINDRYILTNENNPKSISFMPNDVGMVLGKNIIKVVVYDNVLNKGESVIDIIVEN